MGPVTGQKKAQGLYPSISLHKAAVISCKPSLVIGMGGEGSGPVMLQLAVHWDEVQAGTSSAMSCGLQMLRAQYLLGGTAPLLPYMQL